MTRIIMVNDRQTRKNKVGQRREDVIKLGEILCKKTYSLLTSRKQMSSCCNRFIYVTSSRQVKHDYSFQNIPRPEVEVHNVLNLSRRYAVSPFYTAKYSPSEHPAEQSERLIHQLSERRFRQFVLRHDSLEGTTDTVEDQRT